MSVTSFLLVSFFIFFILCSYVKTSRDRKILLCANLLKRGENAFLLSVYHGLAEILQQFDIFSKLTDCGYSRFRISRLFFISIVISFCCTMVSLQWIVSNIVFSMLICLLLSIIIGFYVLKLNLNKCLLELRENTIIFIMLLHGCIQSGMSTDSACLLLEDRMKSISKVFTYKLSLLNARGKQIGLASALKEERIFGDSIELKALCSNMVRFIEVGGGYSEYLERESSRLHTERVEKIRENVATLSAKMTTPMVVLIMLPCLGIMISPALYNSYKTLSHLFGG